MAAELGKIFIPSGAAELRDTFLSDVRLEAIASGVSEPPVGPGTDWYILGTALANISLIQLSNLGISDDNSNVLTATGDELDEIRQALGLPEVEPTGSSGRVVVGVTGGGSATITDGQPLVLPNGAQALVVGTHVGVSDLDEVDVAAVPTGESTNFTGGAKVRFITPPLNVKVDATVSLTAPLTGGTEAETDERKRVRILNRLRNVPAGGNWAHLREIILNNVGDLQDVYVYPALGGPSSTRIACVKGFDVANNDYSRTATANQLTRARAALHAELSSEAEIVVQSVVSRNAAISLRVTIPESAQAGGSGNGWLDAVVWPNLLAGDNGIVDVSVVTSSTQITVSAQTAVSPIAGQTHISWWSRNDRRFLTALITAVAGGSGAWQLTLDTPLVDSAGVTVQTSDYISPAAVNGEAYGNSWISIVSQLGPGEATSDANRLPRSLRHPFASEGNASAFTALQLTQLVNAHPEITDIQYGVVPTSLSIPVSVANEPEIWTPQILGIWKI